MDKNQNKINKKKVFFLIPSFRGGGAERVVLNIVNNLDKNKFDVGLVTISGEGEYKELLSPKVKHFDLKEKRARKAIFKLRKLLKKEKPNIIIANVVQVSIVSYLSSLFLKNKPVVVQVNHSQYLSIIKGINKISKFIFDLSLKKSDYIITISDDMQHDLSKRFKNKGNKIIKIFNIHDLDNINKQKKEKFSDDDINIFKQKPVIIACGRLTEAKGFSYLIKAFGEVKIEFKEAVLLILGQGEKEEELKELSKELNIENSVKFLGFKDNPYKYLYNSDLFVLSSLWEGLPGALIEALACEVPVVSTDCKSGPKEILDNGKIGELVKVKDVDSLSNAMIKVLKDDKLQSKYIELGLKKVKEFDTNKIIKEYEKFLNNV
jgi:glycosyltransferase involved in cell wall biosynthesis